MNKRNNNLIISVLGILAVFTFVITVFAPKEANAQWNANTASNYTYGNNNPGNNTGNNNNNNNNNNNSNTNTETAVNAVPIIYSITPSSATQYTSGRNITIIGDNFVPTSVARWNTSNRDTTYVNSSKLIMYVTDADIAGYGKYSVTVFNPTPGGGFSNPALFTINKKQATVTSTPSTTTTTTTPKKPTTTTPAKQPVSCTTDITNDNSLAAGAIFGSDGFMPKNLFQWLLLIAMILLVILLFRKTSKSKDKYHSAPLKHA